MSKKIFIYSNNKEISLTTKNQLVEILKKKDWTILEEYSDDVDFLACVGGDGTFLSFVHKLQFPSAPIIGINTGHLGFFQESYPANMESTIEKIENGEYITQNIKPVEAKIHTNRNIFKRMGLNEMLIRGMYSHVSQFSVSIDNTKIQDFSGDGMLISTPVGSTAYNYSLGGSLVSPDLDVLQITPMAPMNTSAYRCFHSSILLPANQTIKIEGIGRNTNSTIMLSFDGRTHEFNNVSYVEIAQSNSSINLIRFKNYDYWQKLSTKLL